MAAVIGRRVRRVRRLVIRVGRSRLTRAPRRSPRVWRQSAVFRSGDMRAHAVYGYFRPEGHSVTPSRPPGNPCSLERCKKMSTRPRGPIQTPELPPSCQNQARIEAGGLAQSSRSSWVCLGGLPGFTNVQHRKKLRIAINGV